MALLVVQRARSSGRSALLDDEAVDDCSAPGIPLRRLDSKVLVLKVTAIPDESRQATYFPG